MTHSRTVPEQLDLLAREVRKTAAEDGMLGSPDLYRGVLAQQLKVLGSAKFPVADDARDFERRRRLAQTRLDDAREAARELAAAPKPRAFKPAFAALAGLLAAMVVGVGMALPLDRRPAAFGVGGAAVAVLLTLLAFGPGLTHWRRTKRVAAAQRRAQAAINRIDDQASARADETARRDLWIQDQTAYFDALYLFHRKARGEIAAIEESSDSGTIAAA